jgi:hypothetical protein
MNQDGTADFTDFIEKAPIYSKYELNPMAQAIFATLSTPDNILAMVQASNRGEAALFACLPELRSKYGEQKVFDFGEDFSKQCLGTMVKIILEPFGYRPSGGRGRIARIAPLYISSAAVYRKEEGEARLQVVQHVTVERLAPLDFPEL